MSISEEQVRHVAMLARLGLDDDQVATLQAELSGILEHVEEIQALDLEGVEPTTHAAAVANVTRSDERHECLSPEDALRNAPEREDDTFLIPRLGS